MPLGFRFHRAGSTGFKHEAAVLRLDHLCNMHAQATGCAGRAGKKKKKKKKEKDAHRQGPAKGAGPTGNCSALTT